MKKMYLNELQYQLSCLIYPLSAYHTILSCLNPERLLEQLHQLAAASAAAAVAAAADVVADLEHEDSPASSTSTNTKFQVLKGLYFFSKTAC